MLDMKFHIPLKLNDLPTSDVVGLMGDFSVELFRPKFMLASAGYPMKVHKNQRLLILLSLPDILCGGTNQDIYPGA
jgi:hypothetical protein